MPRLSVADLEGAPALVPFGRLTDAVTVLMISQNGTVLYYGDIVKFCISIFFHAGRPTSISLMMFGHYVAISSFDHFR